MPTVSVNVARSSENYDIEIGGGTHERVGASLRQAASAHLRRVALVSNKRVFKLYGAAVETSLTQARFSVTTVFIGDGERFKTWRTAEKVLTQVAQAKLERSDAIVALGGGVVGDLAGFVASLYLRGITFVNLPTTLLAQIDSSVGGKTGVNTAHGKNSTGTFHHPRRVLIDTATLRTLSRRDAVAGWCEAIKQGAIGGIELFEMTRNYLRDAGDADNAGGAALSPKSEQESARLSNLLAAHVAFKADIVANDERENIERDDHRSRRILNFGHTVAHALEAVTAYRRFRHGEAVGYGMLAAAEISTRLNLLPETDLQTLRSCIALAGNLPPAADVDTEAVMSRLKFDKKSVGGTLKWVLLKQLGVPQIVDETDVPRHIIKAGIHSSLNASAVPALTS
ncbi:MAG: 3-dehydroquinate synthase [Pyrinomonadaceae bacterium MAG19_C2-C3]|nr:3-dehydroquinate synthase [Pyrinomonadaceae bacterium MAG19_C2-C3]